MQGGYSGPSESFNQMYGGGAPDFSVNPAEESRQKYLDKKFTELTYSGRGVDAFLSAYDNGEITKEEMDRGIAQMRQTMGELKNKRSEKRSERRNERKDKRRDRVNSSRGDQYDPGDYLK
jgi:hypothetical protein